MKSINCLIIDDDKLSAIALQKLIEEHSDLKLLNTIDNYEDAFSFLNSNHNVDLVFLDIDINGKSGIELMSKLKSHPFIIITTAFEQFAFIAFEMGVVDYLKKPITVTRFKKAIDRFTGIISQKEIKEVADNKLEVLIFRSGRSVCQVQLQNVLYFESARDYVKIVMENDVKIILITLKEVLIKTAGAGFVQIGKSFVVNVNQITELKSNSVFINKQKLPIGRKYRQQLMDKIMQ
jgi:DNA-binding LytR/AlgR family response regulator